MKFNRGPPSHLLLACFFGSLNLPFLGGRFSTHRLAALIIAWWLTRKDWPLGCLRKKHLYWNPQNHSICQWLPKIGSLHPGPFRQIVPPWVDHPTGPTGDGLDGVLLVGDFIHVFHDVVRFALSWLMRLPETGKKQPETWAFSAFSLKYLSFSMPSKQ